MAVERRRARTLLLVTFLMFFLPIMGAWLLNVFVPGWRPFGTVNHGTLVQPARPVSATGLEDGHGRKVGAGYLSGRWTVVHLLAGPCGKDCLEALARTRQVHRALGGDVNRVQRLVVAADPAHTSSIETSPELAVAVAGSDWLSIFSFADGSAGLAPGIYLIDPQAYLMMRYPQAVGQRGLLADLKRLLKISKVG